MVGHLSWRKHMARLGVTGLLALVGITLIDLGGEWYLQGMAERHAQDIAQARARAAAYRRPVVFGEPVDQNAAVWYRLAFAKSREITPAAYQGLSTAASLGFRHYSSAASAHAEACGEAHGTRVRTALQCAQCDWEIGYEVADDAAFQTYAQALTIAHCLALEGHRRAFTTDWRGAARSYVETIAFGCDLGNGNLSMNLAGIAIAKLGTDGLGQLIVSVDDDELLQSIETHVVHLSSSLPNYRNGLQFQRVELASGLAVETREFLRTHNQGMGRLVPWRAIVALNRARDMALLNALKRFLEGTQHADDLEAITKRAAVGPSVILREGINDTDVAGMKASDDLVRRFRAMHMAIAVQRWHAQHGAYPLDPATITFPRETSGIRYRVRGGGSGFELAVHNGAEWTVLLERPEGRAKTSVP